MCAADFQMYLSPVSSIILILLPCGSFSYSLGGLSTYCRLGQYDMLARLIPVILGVHRV